MTIEPEIHDLRRISCGLVPAMSGLLEKSQAEVVEFHIKQGIRVEIVSSFGTDSTWELTYENHIGMDVARFSRRAPAKDDALNIVDY